MIFGNKNGVPYTHVQEIAYCSRALIGVVVGNYEQHLQSGKYSSLPTEKDNMLPRVSCPLTLLYTLEILVILVRPLFIGQQLFNIFFAHNVLFDKEAGVRTENKNKSGWPL